jgi:catechol 2,3-dioxygenase-like lactoylglutathione lyase family enzyme
MTVRGLRRIIVSVAELDPALAFYRDALGFAERYATGDGERQSVLLDPDGHVLCLVSPAAG